MSLPVTAATAIGLPGGGPSPAVDRQRWAVAEERLARVKRILAAQAEGATRRAAILSEAARHGSSVRSLFAWCAAYDKGGPPALLPKPRRGGRVDRISQAQEEAIAAAIAAEYLTKERGRLKAVDKAYQALAVARGLGLVDIRTIKRRIERAEPKQLLTARYDAKLARERLGPIAGGFPGVDRPLDFVQIDHTPCPVEAVHPETREVVGRPTLTIVLDIFTRGVLAVLVSLLYPSSALVAQAMARAINPKDRWLAHLQCDWIEWPFAGVPRRCHTDGGSDLVARAMRHGLELLDIEPYRRRPACPDDGGHVERMIKTIQQELDELPGKTFANTLLKKGYDSAGRACLTCEDIERIIAIELDVYHRTAHSETGYSPLELWQRVPAYRGPVQLGAEQVRIAFMPTIARRRIQRYGLQEAGRWYQCAEMRRWIGKPHPEGPEGRFLFACDERDRSHVYFFDPEVRGYFLAPCVRVKLSEPARANLRRVRQQNKGRRTAPEVVARAYRETRTIVAAARQKTKAAKRARRRALGRDLPADMQPDQGPPVIEGVVTAKTIAPPPAAFVDAAEIVALPARNLRVPRR